MSLHMTSVRRWTDLLLVRNLFQMNQAHLIPMDYSVMHLLFIVLVAVSICRATLLESDGLGFTESDSFCNKFKYPNSYDFNVSCLNQIQGLEFTPTVRYKFTYLGIHRVMKSQVHLTRYKVGRGKWGDQYNPHFTCRKQRNGRPDRYSDQHVPACRSLKHQIMKSNCCTGQVWDPKISEAMKSLIEKVEMCLPKC